MSDSHYNIIIKCNNHLDCISKIDGYCVHDGYCVFQRPFDQFNVLTYLRNLHENSCQMVELYNNVYRFMWFVDDDVMELAKLNLDILIPVKRKHWHNIKLIFKK